MTIEIYSKPDCPYCSMAKQFLTNRSISFTEKKLNIDFTREFLVESYPEARSYPVIVVDGFYIGGFIELKNYLAEHGPADPDSQLLQE